MAPVTAAVKEKYEGRINFVTLDIRDSNSKATAARLKMEATPTYVFLDKDGKEVGRLVGSGKTVPEFDALLKKAGVAE